MAPTGEVKKVEGISQLAEKMFKNVPQDPMLSGMLDGMKANLSDDAVKNLSTKSFPKFPDKPIKVGDGWNVQNSMANPMLGTLVTSLRSTLKSIDADAGGRVAHVAITG